MWFIFFCCFMFEDIKQQKQLHVLRFSSPYAQLSPHYFPCFPINHPTLVNSNKANKTRVTFAYAYVICFR